MKALVGAALQAAAAALLASFAAAKLAAPWTQDDRPAWLAAALVAAALVELGVALWLVLDRRGARPVVVAGALGAAFVAIAVLAPDSVWPGRGCGCLGAARAERGRRALAGGALALVAGLRLLVPSGGTRGLRPAE